MADRDSPTDVMKFDYRVDRAVGVDGKETLTRRPRVAVVIRKGSEGADAKTNPELSVRGLVDSGRFLLVRGQLPPSVRHELDA